MSKIAKRSLEIAYELFPVFYETVPSNRNYHFCFIYKRNRLVSIGKNDMRKTDFFTLKLANRYKTNVKLKYPYLHSELDAISRLWGKIWVDGSLDFVIIRLNAHGELCDSKPCKRCSGILKGLGVTKAMWSIKEGDIIKGIL